MPARADLVLVGDVLTMDDAGSHAGAVAVAGDRIVAVGTEADVRDRVGPGAAVISGACVLPGFQDAHVHPAFGARNLLNVNLDDLDSKADYLERIRTFAEAHPRLEWIVGGGWYGPVAELEGGLMAGDLDGSVPDRPAFLMNTDVHAAWVNSRALERAGITADSPDPWDGRIERDYAGVPTGILQEGAAYSVLRDVVPRPDLEGWSECLRVAQRELHALGITGWQDAWVEPDLLRAYRALDDAGELTMRVVAAQWWDRHRGLEQVEELVGLRELMSDGRVDASTVKIMLDGCPESCTGAMLAPYEGSFGEAHGRGIAFVEPEALAEAVVRLDGLGFQVHQHALGDRAIRMSLDAVAAARAANGFNDLRHHVAHLQLPDPEDIPRLRELAVVANIQPFWSQPDPAIETLTTPRVGERAGRLYPIGSIRGSGAVVAFGSDWPVTTPNPWLEMEVAVTRQVPGSAANAPALDRSQRIDLETAIAAFTRGSAYLNHDDEAGSIEKGKRADLVVVDRDPFDRELGSIGETRVTTTIAAGRVVFEDP